MNKCQFWFPPYETMGKKFPASICGKRAKEIPVGLKMCKHHAGEFKLMEERQPANAMMMIYKAIKGG